MNIVFAGYTVATLYYQLDIYFLCTLYFVIELLLERTGYSVWIDLLYFGYFFVCTLCVVLPESGVTAFWTLFIFWSGQHSCANFLNISIQTFGVIGYRNHHRMRTLCVIGY